MREIEIDGHYYRCGKLSTPTQLLVVKRLAPVLQGLTPLFAGRQLLDEAGNPVTDTINIFEALAALTNTIGMLSDADVMFILDAALSCVRWRQGDRWQPLRASGGGAFLLGAADALDVQLRLLWEVLAESLSTFSFAKLLPSPATNGLDQTAPPMAAVAPMAA